MTHTNGQAIRESVQAGFLLLVVAFLVVGIIRMMDGKK